MCALVEKALVKSPAAGSPSAYLETSARTAIYHTGLPSPTAAVDSPAASSLDGTAADGASGTAAAFPVGAPLPVDAALLVDVALPVSAAAVADVAAKRLLADCAPPASLVGAVTPAWQQPDTACSLRLPFLIETLSYRMPPHT